MSESIVRSQPSQLEPPQTLKSNVTRRPVRVALVSCGLGHVNRGFEVSTARLFRAVKRSKSLEVKLFTGGVTEGGKSVVNLPRDFILKTILHPLALINKRRTWELAYGIEQVTFAFGLLGDLIHFRPDAVWTKEAPFAHVLLTLRNLLGLKFKIIFANGGGFKPSTYAVFDYVQQLQSDSYEEALNYGIAINKMRVLPNVMVAPECTMNATEARASFGFEPNDWVVLSVAAWNRYHKRIDYLIEEVASIPDENTKLLLCGHPEPDTKFLKALAKQKLGNRVKWYTLSDQDIPRALACADVFVLASLEELFGGASSEAMMAEVPVIAHGHGASQMLMKYGFRPTDLSKPGNLAARLIQLRRHPGDDYELKLLANSVKAAFDPELITQQFEEMVTDLVLPPVSSSL